MKNRLDKIADFLDLKITASVLSNNSINVEIDKLFNYAMPAIETVINNDTVLSLGFKKDGGIAAKIYRGFDNFQPFNTEFKPSVIYGMFELENDNDLEKFIDLFVENLNTELL